MTGRSSSGLRILTVKHPWRSADFWTAMLLIEAENSCILADTGVRESLPLTLIPLFRERKIPWSALHSVINTHAHGDHTGSNEAIRKLSPAEFSIHRAGTEALRGAGFVPDRELVDGDAVSADGITLQIIHTPGHSADSICILEPETGTLFTGDAVQGLGSDNIGLALFCDPEAYRLSLEKIRNLCISGAVRQLVLGHPERPSNGEVGNGALLPFLELSLHTVENYMETTRELLKANPDAGKNELRELLLCRFGGNCSLNWPELSYHTAQAMLHWHAAALKQ